MVTSVAIRRDDSNTSRRLVNVERNGFTVSIKSRNIAYNIIWRMKN